MEVLSEINSAEFTPEQKQYLLGFFAATMQRMPQPFVGHTAADLITHDPASGVSNQAESVEETYFGTPVSDLSREELWKYQQNPLDIWDRLLAHADENRAPAADDLFRFKFHGLFYVAPTQDSFMLRIRVPGGILTSRQMRGLAEMASDWGSGRANLTTRANLQIREFQPKDIVRVLNKVQSLGMSSRGSGADNIRNITASPITGLDSTEIYNVAPLADALHNYILNSRDMYGLPRKFNVAFDNGGAISVVADTNDIGFIATRVGEGRSIPAGIYFRVLLCGITGHKQFATDCGLMLRPEQTIAVAAAMIRVFSENGDRTDRKKARLKYLVDRWGVDKFLEETERRLAFPIIRFPEADCESRNTIDRAGHIGVHPQRQEGFHYIGISVPVGRLPAEQMHALAAVADAFGSGEMRLTVWQNLLIPNIPTERLEPAMAAIRAAGLDFTAGTLLSGTVACTGNRGCRFAATDTKAHAVQLANLLDARFKIEQPVNLHVLISAILFSHLPPVMERLFGAYIDHRRPSETFLDFSRRHSIPELKSFCVAEKPGQS